LGPVGASRRRVVCRDDPISAELRRSRGEVSSYARQRQITHGERAFRRADISTRQTAAIVVLLAKYQEQVWFRCCRGRWPASCRRVGAEDDPTFCCGVCRRITDLMVCVRSRGQPENLPDNAFRCWSLASGRFRHLTFDADRAGRTGWGEDWGRPDQLLRHRPGRFHSRSSCRGWFLPARRSAAKPCLPTPGTPN
jgi:hypothetical protein